MASSISKEQLDDYAGAPEESPVKKARTTEPWELIEGVSQSEDIDFNPPSPSKQSSCEYAYLVTRLFIEITLR